MALGSFTILAGHCFQAYKVHVSLIMLGPRKSEEYKKKKEEAKEFLYAAVSKQVPDLKDACHNIRSPFLIWLVAWNIFCFFSYVGNFIIPIDEL